MNPFNVSAPLDQGSDNYNGRKFTATTTSQAHEIPESWSGKYVVMRAAGDDVHFGFSTASDATIDSGATATAAGASTGVGDVLPNGLANETHRRIPRFRAPSKMYFVRETATDPATVYIVLCDTPGSDL